VISKAKNGDAINAERLMKDSSQNAGSAELPVRPHNNSLHRAGDGPRCLASLDKLEWGQPVRVGIRIEEGYKNR